MTVDWLSTTDYRCPCLREWPRIGIHCRVADALRLRVVLESPPPGVDFGIQKGHGSSFETIQTQRSTGDDLSFDFSVEVRTASVAGSADFGGPIVQGPRGGRFIYVDIGTIAGQRDTPWTRRLKIPLTGVSPSHVKKASSGTHLLEARVPGTGRDGGPSCATVKDFDGWRPLEIDK
jgi:hypothetical protein